jgi:hypothetical protein
VEDSTGRRTKFVLGDFAADCADYTDLIRAIREVRG